MQIQDEYEDDEFETLISDAEMNATNDWEEKFVSDLKDKFDQYGRRMYLSENQREHLERIAGDE
jgi:hypothetical protein